VIDPREYRSALGRFATGVTIITTCDSDGRPVGITANSFSSVSLDPPLVLWSLARSSRSLDAFTGSGGFAIHILGKGQEDLAMRFATRAADKFAECAYDCKHDGIPLLDECLARIECTKHHQYDGGDHVIFIGEVESFHHREGHPLLFFGGQFHSLAASD
jgi:3-hydroxy-9,10-secoandrosta-1,3,5(10)-triene-9,17-dione monooxygenase reductase component